MSNSNQLESLLVTISSYLEFGRRPRALQVVDLAPPPRMLSSAYPETGNVIC